MSGYQGLDPHSAVARRKLCGPKRHSHAGVGYESLRQNFLIALEITQKKQEAGLDTDCVGQDTDGELV